MNIDHIHHHGSAYTFELILALPFVLALVIYILAAGKSSSRHNAWPLYRTACWVFGVFCAAFAVVGPLANRSHMDFIAHMIGHVLLGMLAPLLLVLSAPMTLALRTLKVNSARRLSRMLKSWPVRILSDPIVASLLNVGGLWILYTTVLYGAMQQNIILHMLVHIHVFFAGYLFTVSMIYIDPTPHRTSFFYRAIVLVIALAGHGILSKYIYVHPPNNVPLPQAEAGGMLMYYGGDAIDLILISVLCYQWFRSTRPRKSFSMVSH
ncbi:MULTISPECIES: cytochrome c oxidase assembly protein [unclassified Paenibacillus]|uniref:cytochrome c oxidase assembly protein n=1 Tax=unclassified Paenibacillus TaxID=185978 RepID=UPI001AEB18C6|nr:MULTISPECIES: cytochrome c oxidase assembly protein [unclassified Paenibacillus]MBP1155683.1 putative membrane protein [Paenibacillus sp. PvP091]MBP1168931.1 putative membrane protein [Paenibacillus sp. PvR098]MBP2439959.1 putative membrane protein [Paenibacillus sp. PvP052]